MRCSPCRYLLLITLALVARLGQTAEGPLPAFVKKYCVDCHGPSEAQRGLRLDQLPLKFGESESAARWIKVLDHISTGEMPPADAAQPPAKERAEITNWLRTELHKASLATQQQNGRVLIRRLNRTEYETTLSDLLGIEVKTRDLLPDDNSAAGFDNVSSVLDVSAAHLLRYQEAAERACRAVIPTRPPIKINDRRTGRQITEKVRSFIDMIGKVVKLDGDSLVMYGRTYNHLPVCTAVVPQNGRYRVRAQVRAINSPDKPLPVMLYCHEEYGRSEDDIRRVIDVTEGKPLEFDAEMELNRREMIIFTPWSLPDVRSLATKIKGQSLADYNGPAIVLDWVEVSGPLDPWPLPGYVQLFGDVPLKAASVVKAEAAGQRPPKVEGRDPGQWIYDPYVIAPENPKADAERLIRHFLPRAFRRPATEEQVARFVKIAHAALDQNESFAEAMIKTYKTILCSPHFLFLTPATTDGSKLDDFALATRLSYFLWSTLPDDELLDLAAKGELAKPGVLRAQTERLLNDPRAERFTKHFAGQWLDLRNINATSPDPQMYAEFDSHLFWAMPRETELFFEELLKHDRSVTEFTHSDWTFLNERLAQHYGIADVTGYEMRKVQLPEGSHRGGILTQASILKVTADGTKTSPVMRGKWVLERILGTPPAPPPPDIPAVEPDIRGATTIRQLLAKHRDTAACNSCHKQIDPPGFALESFDVIGGWRDEYRVPRGNKRKPLANYPGRTVAVGLPVELGGEVPDGRKFADIDEYKQLLLADKDQLARNVVHKLIVYSTGADLQFADREVVDQILADNRKTNFGFRSLLHSLVQSRIFLNK
ncbi:DUF1592 domain-containing protein [Anatilimnocola floriformis]|uniref:DUF1592 domain-containing protein n=1 Tax=Anatilimnocola floriformis TaxID=2948575 RepID=UPI0020C2F896|nr:DUF1592 domain-containing protein [Anatilimnocola floriformis]